MLEAVAVATCFQRWGRCSSRAVVTLASSNTQAHSLKLRLVVIITLVHSFLRSDCGPHTQTMETGVLHFPLGALTQSFFASHVIPPVRSSRVGNLTTLA